MKTIKTKKSCGKAYVFLFSSNEKGQTSNSNISREMAEKSLEYYINVGFKCSEISEVEIFEEAEEQVPDVVERYYFTAVYQNGSDKMFSKIDQSRMEEVRQELTDTGCRCSEIKLLREEF